MAKLTKRTVAAVSKGKKETVAKPKTGPKTTPKVAAKPAVKTPVKATRTTRKAIDTTIPPKAVQPVETPKVSKVPMVEMAERRKTPLKDMATKPTVAQIDKSVEEKPKKPRKPRSFVTDVSKFRKYNNELRINLRNLIYDKGFTIAKVAREMGVTPFYLFNILRIKDKQSSGRTNVVVLDIAYAICNVVGVNIKSVLPEAEIVNPIYKSKDDYVVKVNKLQEENVQLNFLYTQTKQQLDAQSIKLAANEARVKELENFLESSISKIDKIRERLTNYPKAEERISKSEESKS